MMRPIFFALASLGLSTALAAQTLIIPAPVADGTTEGNGTDSFPFNRTSATATSNDIRIQFVYDSTDFAGPAGAGPILISGLRFRPNAATATTTWVGGVYSNCQIRLGPSQFNYDAITTSFAGNYVGGVEPAPVYSGPVTVQPGAGAGTGIPGAWYIQVNFPPILFDAAAGQDFILDIGHDGTWVPNSGTSGGSTNSDYSTTTQGSLTRRMYNSSDWTSPNGTGVFTSGSIVTELTYVPAIGTFASFTPNMADVGPTTMVNFTDTTFTSIAGGIVAWDWDFNGDLITDSTSPNPSWNVWNCGPNTVTLTVTDAASGQSTRTGTINALPPVSSFTASPSIGAAPLSVTFTDTSSNTATSWEWDLDGDSVTDSTLQNPTFVYPTPGVVTTVTMTASNACGVGTTTTQTISTVFPLAATESISACGVSFTFAPNGTGYTVSRGPSLYDPNIGVSVGITGDDVLAPAVDLTFMFPWPDGVSSNLIRIDSNGRVVRDGTETSSDFTPTVTEMRTDAWPSILSCWTDWQVNNVNTTGDIYFGTNGSSANVTWLNVAQNGAASRPCTHQATLLPDGTVILTIEDFVGFNPPSLASGSRDDLIVGICEGNGVVDPGELDFSALSGSGVVTGFTPYEFFDQPAEVQDLQDTFLRSLTNPQLGGMWDLRVTNIRPTATLATVLIGSDRVNLPLASLGLECNLLISPIWGQRTLMLDAVDPTQSEILSIPISSDVGQLGFQIYMQAVTDGGSNPTLSIVLGSGIAGTLGF